MAQGTPTHLCDASTQRREERLAAARALAAALSARGAARVILFGSLAVPAAFIGENSDVDLAVVMPGVEGVPFHRRLSEDPDVQSFPFALDLLVYTPHEWTRLSEERAFLRHEVAERGLTLA